MEILGIGPLELVFILLIALIVLGPNDMVKAGRTIGRFLRKIVTSPTWRTVQQTSRDIRYLPNKLMREAGLEDLKDQIPDAGQIRKDLSVDDMKKEKDRMDKEISSGLSDWTTPPLTIDTPQEPPSVNPKTAKEPVTETDQTIESKSPETAQPIEETPPENTHIDEPPTIASTEETDTPEQT